MIFGVGADIIEVSRVADKINRREGFREFVFSTHEIDYCESMATKFEHYAARFAAKEAFLKALKTGWTTDTNFNEIEMSQTESGSPEIKLLGKTKDALQSLMPFKIHVSLSHLKDFAIAFVILEK